MSGVSRFSEKTIAKLYELIDAGYKQKHVAQRLGMSPSNVSGLLKARESAAK